MFRNKKSKRFIFETNPPATEDAPRIFARLFASDDGQKALAYLKTQTFMRAAPMDAPTEQLRYIEGQRGLMALILRLIERGQRA